MREERSLTVSGFVIANREYRDMDRSVTVFTKDLGKFSFVARGVRKITSKNRSSTDLFVHGEYFLNRGKKVQIQHGSLSKHKAQ